MIRCTHDLCFVLNHKIVEEMRENVNNGIKRVSGKIVHMGQTLAYSHHCQLHEKEQINKPGDGHEYKIHSPDRQHHQ